MAFLIFFRLIQAEKATFNLTLSETDLNYVHFLFQFVHNDTYTLCIPVYVVLSNWKAFMMCSALLKSTIFASYRL